MATTTSTQLVTCQACGATNRVAGDRLAAGQVARCGRCRAPLAGSAGAGPVVLTDRNFEATVATGTVLVDCWAPWCGPCRAFGPVVDALATELAGRVTVGKLNIDENPGVAGRYRVMSIPTVLLFRDGRLVAQQAGAMPRAQLLQWLASNGAA